MRIILLCLFMVGSVFANPTVSNIRVSQRENTKLVDILYDVSFVGGDTVDIRCEVSTNAGASFDIPASSFSGDYGAIVSNGIDRLIVWDAGIDWNENYSDQMAVRIIASAPRFVDTGDGTVTDNASGLIWRRITEGVYNYNGAMSRCGQFGEGWRIPTMEEFEALADESTISGLPYGHPFVINEGIYWSSTLSLVSFTAGETLVAMKGFSFYNRGDIPVQSGGSYITTFNGIPTDTGYSIYLLAVKRVY